MRRALIPLCVVLAVAGCTAAPPAASPQRPLTVSWREVTLPVPPGSPGRLAVRDAVRCAGEWYVVGGVFTGPGESRPAAWRSADGRTWTSVRFAPRWYWAHRNVIASVACRDGTVAMVGAKSGGAHGNPRVSTWHPRDDGVFVDVIAAFELYGGPKAVNVGRLAAGKSGWMIIGNRMTGAAVWLSDDATDFRLVDSDPELASDATTDTAGQDLTYAGGSWTVVGSATLAGRVARVPMAWGSTDGGETWHRQRVPHGDAYADLQRVTGYRGGVLAAGVEGAGFAAWRRSGDTWQRAGRFGAIDPDGPASPFVSGLTVAGDQVVAVVSDSARYSLWTSPDAGAHWRRVTTPAAPTTAGEHHMTAVADGGQVVLLADDAKAGRVWLADWPGHR